ncbi:MAG: hypothetical protein HYY60_00985 [Parcubacteria group bacterium]|nr:hypothetical protein [Parcubacteria group bacterium]MBI3075337.1 hypothetical protein [Parcubacteria group bacterium]
MDTFLSAVRMAISAVVKYVHRTWWMLKHHPEMRIGSAAEFKLQKRYLDLRYRIEVEERKNYDEEIARWRREIAVMMNTSKLSSKLL